MGTAEHRTLELFTGAGGLAMGITSAGFETELVVEKNRLACETIRVNKQRRHPLVQKWKVDDRPVEAVNLSSLAGVVDLVAGGPPCQPFSLGGRHRAFMDERDMFPQAVRAIREVRPRAFIFENVKGLARPAFATYFEYIKLQLEFPEIARKEAETIEDHLTRLEKHKTGTRTNGLRYRVVSRVLNAADYGVPQKRERIFIVGFRWGTEGGWSFPEPTHSQESLLHEQWQSCVYWDRHEVPRKERPEKPCAMGFLGEAETGLYPWRTVRDGLVGIPEPRPGRAYEIHNHVFQPNAKSYPGHTGSPLDEPAKALKAGVHGVPGGENMIRYPDGRVRYLTVREAARLQTFPDDYFFPGCWTEAMRQLGNAVPVELARIVAASVLAKLNPPLQLNEAETA